MGKALNVVVFTKRHSLYNGGQTAGFPPDEAARLVKAGVARYPSDIADEKIKDALDAEKAAADASKGEAAALKKEHKAKGPTPRKKKVSKRPAKK